MVRILLIMLIMLPGILNAQSFDTAFVWFDIGSAQLKPVYQDSLSRLATSLQPQQRILIYGYADYLGTASPNHTLSQDRANAVAKFIKGKLPVPSQIKLVEGLGQFDEVGKPQEHGNLKYRKVMLLISTSKTQPKVAVKAPKQSENEPPPVAETKTIVPDVKVELEKMKNKVDQSALNETFVLENIFFYQHRADLMPESKPVMYALLHTLNASPKLKIAIEGHICCNAIDGYIEGSPAFQLSVLRAKYIYDFLLLNRIAADRIEYKGFGRTQPIYEEELFPYEQAANRRVEIRVLAK